MWYRVFPDVKRIGRPKAVTSIPILLGHNKQLQCVFCTAYISLLPRLSVCDAIFSLKISIFLAFFLGVSHLFTRLVNIYSRIALKPINIRRIRTGSQPSWKFMSCIVLYPVFYEYKMYNHKIKTSFS